MKLSLGKRLGRLLGLIVVTVFAVAVMYVSDGKWLKSDEEPNPNVNELGQTQPKSLVAVQAITLESEVIEIVDSYAGTIEPFERHVVALEIPGKINLLGQNQDGQMLDVGDEVIKGQVLATLDQRILKAQLAQATATLGNSEADYNRLTTAKQKSPGSVTETVYQEVVTQIILAKAKQNIAEKNLENATVTAPAAGVISKRLVNPGESVNLRQQLFEIVEVDRVLLSLGIPESRIGDVQRRFNQVKKNQRSAINNRQSDQVAALQEDELKFKVIVQSIGHNRYGDAAEEMIGHVYRIGETADERNSLFRVQVVLKNKDRMLKPGLVAMASLVTDTIQGYRFPIESVLFRDNETYVYFIDQMPDLVTINLLDWEVGKQPEYQASKVPVLRYVEQGDEILIEEKDLLTKLRFPIIRGQHRLTDGDQVQLVPHQSKVNGSSDVDQSKVSKSSNSNLNDQSLR
ncbi:MAG: efflux RND transporter periplasmic adaptor subunit [Pirellulales bacterium]